MTVSRDKGSMKQRNLIAVWTSDNLTRDKNGKVNGAWIDVQFDQHEFCPDDQDGSKLAVSAVRKGYLKAVPSINVEYDGQLGIDKAKPVWYPRSQIAKMAKANGGHLYEERKDGRVTYAVSFKGNLARVKGGFTNSDCTVVLMGKNPDRARTPSEWEDMLAYNARNPFGMSDFGGVTSDMLFRQLRSCRFASLVDTFDTKGPDFSRRIVKSMADYNPDLDIEVDDDFVSAPKAGNVHAADVRSDPVRPVPGRHDYVGVFHARGQYVYAAQMRVPLIGVWSDEDIRYSKNGNIRGVYVDVQVDQSTMRPSDVARGRGYGSSSIQSVYGDRDAESVGKIYFPKRQFDIIMVAGIQASYGATYGCSFTGDVFVRETITSKHKLAPFVFVPTDGLGGDGDAFCEEHRPFGSMHVSFDGNDLKNQLEVTSAARSRDMRTDVSKENHSFLAAVENGGAYPGPSEPEEQSDHSFS